MGRLGELTHSRCGENRYDPVPYILQFTMKGGCDIDVEPRDAILSKVRLQWTTAEFWADGGSTSFATRLAGALGIHESQVKVVAVYEGSVIIHYYIYDDPEEPGQIENYQKDLETKIKSNMINFGAPIMEADVGEGSFFVIINNNNGDDEEGEGNGNGSNGGGSSLDGDVLVGVVTGDGKKDDSRVWQLLVIVLAALLLLVVAAVIVWVIKIKFSVKQELQKKAAEMAANQRNSVAYEEQYHPKAELGRNIYYDDKGKKKANDADDVDDEEEKGDESSDAADPKFTQTEIEHPEMREHTPLHSQDNERNSPLQLQGFDQNSSSANFTHPAMRAIQEAADESYRVEE